MPSTADEKRMKSRAASLAYYYANKEAILKAAAEKLKAKRVAEFGSEEAWQAHLERMNREKALAASKENSYPRLCYRLLAAAASHPDVLAFSLRGLHAMQEQKRKKGREYMRSYGAKPEAKQAKRQRDRRLAIRRGRPNPAAWPAVVWLHFLDAVIAQGRKDEQFTPEMNWDNYGSYWHVDHIRPCASFDLSRRKEQHRCFHFSNLQPLEGRENVRKGATYAGN